MRPQPENIIDRRKEAEEIRLGTSAMLKRKKKNRSIVHRDISTMFYDLRALTPSTTAYSASTLMWGCVATSGGYPLREQQPRHQDLTDEMDLEPILEQISI
jgi:hypothetical protein